MNKAEQVLFENELKKIIFSYSKKDISSIYPDRTKKRRKKEYEKLACSLKLLKELKERQLSSDEKTYSYVKPIYTDEDIEFLKQAVINNELSIADLTFDEAIMVGFSGENYRRASRKACSEVNFSSKDKRKEFKEKLSKMNSPTPQIVISLYKQMQKKK